MLLQRLPPESEFKTDLRDSIEIDYDDLPEPEGDGNWSKTDSLIAALVDQVAFLRWEQGGASGPPPGLTPRPGVKQRPANVRAISPAVEAYLQERARLRGGLPSPEWMREHGLA